MTISEPVSLIVLLALLSFIPVIIVTGTAFIKIGIVLSLLRNALGVQQIPSNLTMHTFALILTMFVMGPVIFDIKDAVDTDRLSSEPAYLADAVMQAEKIYSHFLIKNTAPESRQFFQETVKSIWPERYHPSQNNPPLYILLPSFTLSELINAFKMGFLLYLPFLAIDFIVSNILLAMGMMMVSLTDDSLCSFKTAVICDGRRLGKTDPRPVIQLSVLMMDQQLLFCTGRMLWLIFILSLPAILAATIVGVLVAIIQAITQIQEQTLGFLCKLTAVVITLFMTLSWSGQQLLVFMNQIFGLL